MLFRSAGCGLVSGRLSTSHSGIPAHSAMNGTASSTFIQTMVVMVHSFRLHDHTARRGSGYVPNDLCPRYESVTFL